MVGLAAAIGAGFLARNLVGQQKKPLVRVASKPDAKPSTRLAKASTEGALSTTTVGPPSVSHKPAASSPDPLASTKPKLLTTEEIVASCEASVGVVQGVNSTGSGFLVGPGLLATNAHVIRRIPAASIRVSFPSAPPEARGPVKAIVIHFDDERDLAILAVDSHLAPLTVVGDHALRHGQDVVFIGSPGLGGAMILENVVARGILGSRVRIDDTDYYQLSGSVNGGNSGGPVIDTTGRVVGVVTARAVKEEGLGFCVPAADLAKAVASASARNPARMADASRRHEAATRLASVSLAKASAVDRGGEPFVAEFLRKTEPGTWLASVDSNLILKDTSPRVTPFRQRLHKVDTIYLEDDRTIAVMAIQFVTKVRDAGLPFSCATLLESSLTWASDSYLRGSKPRSFLAFGEAYVELRVNERLSHRDTIVRMQAEPAGQPSAKANPGAIPPPPEANLAAVPKPIAKVPPKLPGPDSPAGKLETARSLEAGDLKEAAISAYEAVIEHFPQTMQAGIAKNRLKVLKPDPKVNAPSPYNPNKIVPRG